MTGLVLPGENRSASPYTGYTREHWAAVADHLLLSLRPYFSSTRARVLLPGPSSSSGVDSDGLEGFARSFLLYGFRIVGENGVDPHRFTEWYRDGIIAGTDPDNPERWPLPGELNQAKVEAASIALILGMTRPWLWDTLDATVQQHVIDWLSTASGGWYPQNNWLWFRVTVETFLSSVGGPYSRADIMDDLDRFESFYRGGGWYADGVERAYDYYCGWAMHLYPLLWTDSRGAERFGARELGPVWRGRLEEFLDDYIDLIGADGSPVMEGRSLVYRFATAAPLWMGAYTGATTLTPGVIRRAASGILRAFVDRGGIDESGLLPLGFFRSWPAMAQSYSGSGSPYWAAKGMLGLALPADHPVWTAVEEPLPVESGDERRVIAAAGWLISATRADGVTRVINHGTDHALAGARTSDSPLYARWGYSSATMPPLTGNTLDSPVDNTVGAVDAGGRLTHRSGFTAVRCGDDGSAAFATSVADTRWVDTSGHDGCDAGSGRTGTVVDGPRLTCASLVRGSWEVRVVRVDRPAAGGAATGASTAPGPAASDGYRIRFAGWPLAGRGPADVQGVVDAERPGRIDVEANGLRSSLVAVVSGGAAMTPARHIESGTSPLGEVTAVPHIDFADVRPGGVLAVAVRLGGSGVRVPPPAVRVVPGDDRTTSVVVNWPGGTVSSVTLPACAT